MRRFALLVVFLFFFIGFFSCGKNDDVTMDFPIVNLEDSITQDSSKPSYKDSSEFIYIFGDIQYYTNSRYISIYEKSLDWIADQIHNGKQVKCVLHTGDITQSNSVSQWKQFKGAMQEITKLVPYFSMIGDHDYTWYDGRYIDDRKDTHFNEYVNYPLSTNKVVAWFEEGRMENVVVEITIHDQPLYLLILEFGPRPEVVSWANEYVHIHSDMQFILLNHRYLENGGGRRIQGYMYRFRTTTNTTPDKLWNQLIRCNDNILCVLCGHVGGLYAIYLEENDLGREVPQIQHNLQGSSYRYDNWLMQWEFPANDDSVNVSIINTKTLKFYNDNPTLFRFRYR